MATVTKPELSEEDVNQSENLVEVISGLPSVLTPEQDQHLLLRLSEPPRPLTPAMQRAILTYQRYMSGQNGD